MKVSYNGQLEELPIESTETLLDVMLQLEAIFHLAPPQQKLIHKGTRLSDLDATLESLGLTDRSKLQLLGTPEQDVAALAVFEASLRHREQVIATRKAGKVAKARDATFASLGSLPTVRFQSITPLPEDAATPHFEKRSSMLHRLANDPAIVHIMEKRDLRVGDLTELHPLRVDRSLMGLNKNAGQQILVR
jgi:hypothetical protein